ncbi:leukotriene A-4 hydrolase-like [Temnothorax curvispinosus]|uniref:Leukotriene A-4 hydrolase-like n=1 Tax=Temnothorax curvispinosus TaxID=300111 RepID=A0A6J1RD63_9HYME|nr:leukotriene A-4 hydrolase-like [Temnothorax curvispinosus]
MEMLDSVDWHFWFGDTFPRTNFLTTPPHLFHQMVSLWEDKSFSIVKKWINWDNRVYGVPPPKVYDHRKLDRIYDHFFRGTISGKIRFLWLLLCIKVRWADKVALALNFATEHCSPNYACPIFQHLYE